MVPIGHVRMGSTGVRAPVWTASGIRHWKRLIKIPGGTDCYYCINDMTWLSCYMYAILLLFMILYPISCYLYTCYFTRYHVTCILVTLPGICYTFCIAWHTTHVLHCIYYTFCTTDIITVCTPYRIVITLHRPICLYTSIMSPLACSLLSHHH